MKYLFLFALFFSFSVQSHSQVEYDAYIITLTGDTINGKIKIPVKAGALSFQQFDRKINFNDSSGFKTYKAGEIKGFGIKEEGLTGHYLSFRVEKWQVFLKRITHGYWQMYDQAISESQTVQAPSSIPGRTNTLPVSVKVGDGRGYYLLVKGDPVRLDEDPSSGIISLKLLREIFAGQPEILAKLNAEMQWFHLKEVLDEFNKNHASSR